MDFRSRLVRLKSSAGAAAVSAEPRPSPSPGEGSGWGSRAEPVPPPFLPLGAHPASPPSPSPGGGSGWGSRAESALPALGLGERLARLRTARAGAPSRGGEPPEAALARLCGGEYVAPGLLLVERRYALPHTHGCVPIGFAREPDIPVPIRRGDTRQFAPARLLMLDTETTGLAGGTGTMAFLVGIARFEPAALTVRQYVVTGFSAEPAMLAAVREWVDGAECLVTFNGKSFDVPLLKTRYALQRERHPFEEIAHADLLHATRRRLRDGWPDCRLKTTAELALGFTRIDDMPGSEVPLAWQRWLRHRDPAPVPRILDHNREDLVSLAALLAVLAGPTAKEAPLLANAR